MASLWVDQEGLTEDEWEGARLCPDCLERYFVNDATHEEECLAPTATD